MAGAIAAYQEKTGTCLSYTNFSLGEKFKFKMKSKRAMLGVYSPAALISLTFVAFSLDLLSLTTMKRVLEELGATSLASILSCPSCSTSSPDKRSLILATALSLHFCKRILQVLFLEPYSGSMDASHGIALSTMYVTMVTNLLYAQMQANGLTSPKADLMWPGVLVFLVGIVGNLYHHAMLARIRTENKKDFPHGGLFEYLVCPQYVFEELVFLGFFMIAQTVMALVTFVSVFMYLTARTYNTKMWYTKKNAHFPPQRKLLIPKLF
ncbi:unnamed protein product [Sphagnum jensenii]|uniref:3-oxo-5-alpha-steroid 4-dehydrogenase C-terminal domain-containing protein n=1 Tax=Sphagnum jensenii TaxID=128206 RepID=A0ABP1AJW1_9BRYO